MPGQEDMEIKIMQYGDMSSLVVEYPDYNSFGAPLITIGSITGSGSWSTESKRYH